MTEDSNNDRGSAPTRKGVGDALVEGLPFSVGSTIAGKYRVDRVLGAGGMGVILAGHHVALDQRVAIKVLKPGAIDNAELVARFGREARAAAKLRSEHVARVLDVGESESGLPYMVMEYLSGKDLSRVVREQGPLPVLEAADYVMQACEGLAEAHRAGIIHRDLKPANLFLTKGTDGSPLVKVLDFGISKVLSKPDDAGPSEGLTQTQAMIGSPHYMSPEQLKSAKDVDVRTDIWSLGGVLFKLLTNESAFEGASTPELCVAILVGPPRDLRQLRPDVPEGLVQVVLKCLEKDANARFKSVTELAAALVAYAPPHSAQSVERIARVGAVADPRAANSDPPKAAAPARTAPAAPVLVPANADMTTMTSSASSLPNDQTSDSALAARIKPRRMWPLAVASAAVIAVVAGVFMLPSLRHRHDGDASTTPATGLVAPPVATTGESVEAPVVPPRPALSIVPLSSVAPSATTAPSAKVSGRSAPLRPGTATAAAPASKPSAPTATALPPPMTPPTQTSSMPDFGGRK